jgi:quercetin dioxygenase-like cupin family protein
LDIGMNAQIFSARAATARYAVGLVAQSGTTASTLPLSPGALIALTTTLTPAYSCLGFIDERMRDMNDRRDFLAAGLAGLAASLLASHPVHAAPSARPVAHKDAPAINLEGWQMTATEVTYPPGESSGRHRHPGFVVGYVLEGQYQFAVNEQPPTVLSAGQMFFESFDSPGEVHAVSGNASATQPTKILAIVFTKKGDPVTIPGD